MKNFATSSVEQNTLNWNNLEEKYDDVYSSIIFKHDSANWYQNKTTKLNYFFTLLPALNDRMTKVFNNAEDIAQKQIQKFKSLNKNFDTDIKVYFIPSALSFNGRVSTLPSQQQRYVLLIGVDGIIFWNSDIDVLFSHELFHMHHFNKATAGTIFTSIVAPFWNEGLASYYSQVSNPKKNLGEILMDPELGKSCESSKYVNELAKKFLLLTALPVSNDKRPQVMREWLSASGEANPHRPGYCLGFRIVESLAKTYTLEEMISWGDMDFEKYFNSTLAELAK